MNVDRMGADAWSAVQTHLLDCLTLMAAGRNSDRVRRAAAAAGTPDPAFTLSLACGALGLDDFDEATRTHPGAVLVPALLVAAAEHPDPVAGPVLAAGLVSGYELLAWLGAATDARRMHLRGRHPSAVLGIPSAAVAVARLLGLDEHKIQAALGIGAGFACGLTEFDDREDMRAVQTAWAASAGLRAARLADAGFPASERALEANGGYLGANGSSAEPVAEMGLAPFAVESVSFKPYPHFSDLHPATAALFVALQDRRVPACEVAAVRAHLTPTANARLHRGSAPRSPKEAKRSAPFALAACLCAAQRTPTPTLLDAFTERRLRDPEVLALAERVEVLTDLPDVDGARATASDVDAAPTIARVEVVLVDGEVLTGSSTGYPGDGRDPRFRWTLMEARRRFDMLTADARGPTLEAAHAGLTLALDLQQVTDVRPAARMLVTLALNHWGTATETKEH
jgi:2-methylcitrate dehydratase PrpD